MKRKGIVTALAFSILVAACGKGDDEVDKLPEAPKRNPMELAKDPPMSSADIDAIVKDKMRSANVAAPDGNAGNTSDANTKGK